MGQSTELLTEAEAAKMLRNSVPTLRRWRRLGTGPAFIKSGRKVLYRRAALDAWIAEQERPQPAETSEADPG